MIKKIFITGATGFIGQHLAEELRDENFFIYALTREEATNGNKNIQFIKGDLFKLSELSDILSTVHYFIHIAGEKKNEAEMYKINVEGTDAVLSEIVKYPNIRLVHISSAGIYGIKNHPETELTEASSVFPDNAYEKTKFEAEELIKKYGKEKNLNYTILRPTNVFGENDGGKKLLTLIKAVKKNYFFYINPKAIVNYVYVKQLTYLIYQIIDSNLFKNKIYNVNSPCNISEFIPLIKYSLNLNGKLIHIPHPFSYMIKIAGIIGDMLPVKYQFINSGKYRELTSKKFYSTSEIKKEIMIDERKFLREGIQNLLSYYAKKGLI